MKIYVLVEYSNMLLNIIQHNIVTFNAKKKQHISVFI